MKMKAEAGTKSVGLGAEASPYIGEPQANNPGAPAIDLVLPLVSDGG